MNAKKQTPAEVAAAFPYIRKLHALGVYVGVRDPARNRAFAGAYMVAERLDVGATDDASIGGYCIVGDNLLALVVTACADLD